MYFSAAQISSGLVNLSHNTRILYRSAKHTVRSRIANELHVHIYTQHKSNQHRLIYIYIHAVAIARPAVTVNVAKTEQQQQNIQTNQETHLCAIEHL